MVSETDRDPTHHVSITKDGTTVSFNLSDARGKLDKTAIIQSKQQRLSIKMASGGTKHSDYQPPYATYEKRDWSGGRGLNDEGKDVTRFMDSKCMHTFEPEKLMLGPLETFGTGYCDADTNMWEDTLEFVDMHTSLYGISAPFTASASYDAERLYVILANATFTGKSAQLSLYDDAAGLPDSELTGQQMWLYQTGDYGGMEYAVYAIDTGGESLTSGTKYHVVIMGDVGDTATDHTKVACTKGATKGCYYDGSWHASYDYRPYFRVTSADSSNRQFRPMFFYHAGIPHVVCDYDNHYAPKIYQNGDYGFVSESTTGGLTCAGKSWVVDEWIGSTVVFITGKGSDALKRSYTIDDNDSNSLSIDGTWDVKPDSSTFFAIIDTNKWVEVTGHGITQGPVMSVCPGGNHVAYIMLGDGTPAISMRYPSLSTGSFDILTGTAGTFMEVARGSFENVFKLWKAMRNPYSSIDYSDLPWGDYTAVSAAPSWSDTQGVTNGDMELDASWADIGTPTTSERSGTQEHTGTYSWHVVADADAEGISQAQALNVGDRYRVSAWVYVVTGSANGVKLTMGGEELDDIGTDFLDQWVQLNGHRTAAATSENIQILSDGGAADFYVDNVWKHEYPLYVPFSAQGGKITNLLRYGEPEKLFILSTNGIAKEENGILLSIPIRELEYASDDRNGLAACVHDVYLFFSFLDGVERYYKSNVDDVGPNRDEGLPANRRGNVSDMKVYPGRIYAAIDGGKDNYSCILLYNDLGWHEVFRADMAGQRIRGLYVQPIPGEATDKIWFGMGAELMWIPVELNPETNSSYQYKYFGTVETGRFYYGKHEVDKYWKSVKVVTEFDHVGWTIYVDYKVDNNDRKDATWVNIGSITKTLVTDDPSTTLPILDASGDKVTGKGIKFRLRVTPNDFTETPLIKAFTVDFIEQVPTKESWQMTFLAEDDNVTLQGTPSYDRVETGMEQLQVWEDEPDPATIASMSSMIDGKELKILSLTYKFILIDERSQKEKLLCTMTVIET